MRNYAQIQLNIWNNDEFRALPVEAQHLYFVLLSHPSLSHAGVGDWRPGRIAKLASGWDRQAVEDAAQLLIAELFILVDEDTEEYLIRSYVRNDPLMKQPNMATAMARKLAEVGSPELHGVVIHELKRLKNDDPGLPGWGSKDASGLLKRGSVDPSDYPLGKGSVKGSIDPSEKGSRKVSGKGSVDPSGNPLGTPSGKGSVKGSEKGCPTPAPAPNTSTPAPKESGEPSSPAPSSKARRLSPNWEPKAATREFMNNRHPEIDQEHELEKFRDYWTAKSGKDATKLDWDATYRNWIRRAAENTTRTQAVAGQPDGRSITDWMPAQWLQEPPVEYPPIIDAEAIEQ